MDTRCRVTLGLIALLGAVFLKGFGEAIGSRRRAGAFYICALNRGGHRESACFEIVPRPDVLAATGARAVRELRQPVGMIGAALLVFPAPGARPLRLRDRRGGHAAGARATPRTHAERPTGAYPQHAQAADRRGLHHERAAARQRDLVTTLLIPHAELSRRVGRPTVERWRTWRIRVPGRTLRHRLRHQHHPDPLVRRGLRDGRAVEHRAALSAALRHGPGLGTSYPSAGADLHAASARRDRPVPRRRRGAGAARMPRACSR